MRAIAYRYLLAALCISFMVSTALAQKPPAIPDTPSGKILTYFLDAFNSGHEAALKSFIDSYWQPSEREGAAERRLGLFNKLYCDLGIVDLHKIIKASDYEITALMHSKTAKGDFEWVEATFYADTLSPHKLTTASVRPGEDPKYAIPDEKLNEKQMAEFFDRYIGDMVAADRFSGTVLIAKNGDPFYTRAHGEACKRYIVPNKLDTKFNLGSMNKMFTGVAIMQLVEQGKMALDDKVEKYLPDIPNKEIAEKVTID